MHGWKEYKATGRYPDREELANRINSSFVADIDYLDGLIEQSKPDPPPSAEK